MGTSSSKKKAEQHAKTRQKVFEAEVYGSELDVSDDEPMGSSLGSKHNSIQLLEEKSVHRNPFNRLVMNWIPGPIVTPKTPVRLNKIDHKRFQLQCIICGLKNEGACVLLLRWVFI